MTRILAGDWDQAVAEIHANAHRRRRVEAYRQGVGIASAFGRGAIGCGSRSKQRLATETNARNLEFFSRILIKFV
jgi:hypothetical protein